MNHHQQPVVWVACAASLLLLTLLPSPASAFLPTYLNYSDPQLDPVFCPSEMTQPTQDHKAITREALRREVRRFFLDNPPLTNETFTIPEDATLSQIYRAYYGENSSPARFIKAVNSITWSNALMETSGQQRFNTAFHMDAEDILQGHAYLQSRYQLLVSTITKDGTYDLGRELLGQSLNGIQDFYSQTTWIELGNTGVLEGLGLPGANIGDVAGPDDPTCTNCADAEGECRDNVITSGKLTSGYYEFTAVGADDFIVSKPEAAGKCSHGGSLDASIMTEATGGINKETSSPCFSPHHYLHQQAVDLAISASELYIGRVRDAIGDQHFLGLLDLYRGSALSIVIDVSASMSQELNAVKEEARLIVENTHPEVYVLLPYGDPEYGPVTKTTDEEEFLEVLDSLSLQSACCCLEEKFWHGLQLALANTPDYSSVFCFTDAGANDAELMDGIMALAAAKHCKVSIIYSYENGRSAQEEGLQEGGERSCPGYVVSGTDEYKQLASLTGGIFVEIDKFDIDEVLGIMEDAVEQSKVTIRARDDVTGLQDFTFPIDESIVDFQVFISGTTSEATLSDPLGKFYDLMNKDELEAMDNVVLVTYTSGLKAITITAPTLGDWSISVTGSTAYSLAISATSTLGFLSEFSQVELEPPRPGYVLLRGKPLAGQTYYVEVTLVGYLESGVESLINMQFVSKSGEVLSLVEYTGPLDDHMYLLSEPLPPNAFYIQVDGYLETGSQYSRLFETMATPVEVLIDLVEAESTLVASPGESTQATFRVFNNGPDASFTYSSSDESEYITSWTPTTSTISSLGYEDVVVSFSVPSSELPGTTSTVTFTATSDLQSSNTNTYITYYLVVDTEEDMEPPICSTSDLPDCSDYSWDDTCDDAAWTVAATLQDGISGLDRVYSRPPDGLTVDTFSDGTNDPVSATYNTSCCVRQVDIIGVDKRGNVGYCKWDLGEVKTWIVEFVVESVGETWAQLRWNISETRSDFLKYTILIDNFFSEDNLCPNLVCHLNVTYLQSCTVHTFDLTPFFSADPGFTTGSTLTTSESTLGSVPGIPTNPSISYTTETSTTLAWDPPTSDDCLDHYQVCYTMVGTTETTCVTSPTNNITLLGLEACTLYHIAVTSVSTFGAESPELKFDTNTDEAAPGAPENLRVTNQTTNWVALAWDDPRERANCIDAWMITYGETETPTMKKIITKTKGDLRKDPIITSDNFATIAPLTACTNFTFWVSGVSPSGYMGSTRKTQTTMAETKPTPVSSVEAVPLDESSLLVVWTPGAQEECVTFYHVCVTDVVDLIQDCVDTSSIEETFVGLEACIEYDITVTPVSPSGVYGTPAYDIADTGDLPASPPTNLRVNDVTAHSAKIMYGPPEVNPRCVVEYDTVLMEKGKITKYRTDVATHLEEIVSGLASCSDYEYSIRAVTATGYQSEWVSVNFTTGEDTPSEPRSLSHLSVTTSSVQLRWFVPETNPWCAETYRVSWTSAGGDSGSRDISVPNHPPEVVENVDGLAACTTYTFSVSALSPLGTEGPAASHDATTAC